MLIGIGVAVACLMVFLCVFLVEQRRAQYEGYARQLYYDTLLYIAAAKDVAPYDAEDADYYYITDVSRLAGYFPHGGKIEVALGKNGQMGSAQWEKTEQLDFFDRFAGLPAKYP